MAALLAIDRVDRAAEPILTFGGQLPSLNGFLVRDDVRLNSLPANGPLVYVKSDMMFERSSGNLKSAMSQDQLIALLFGLAMIDRFCTDSDVQTKVHEITSRLYGYLVENDWKLYLPLAGHQRYRVPRGLSARWAASAIETIVRDVLGDQPGGYSDASFFSSLILKQTRWFPIPKSYNQSMALTLAALTDIWGKGAQKRMLKYGRRIYPLLYAAYRNQKGSKPYVVPAYSEDVYLGLLHCAPNLGPAYGDEHGWDSWNRFYSPPSETSSHVFAGLDYMLLYNLYTIQFSAPVESVTQANAH